MSAVPQAAELFAVGATRCVALARDEAPRLQRFLEANPAYYHAVMGCAPGPHEALEEFDLDPPAEMPFGRKWILAFQDPEGSMVAMANVVSDLIAEGVWHVGLFIVATPLHGSGTAAALYARLEAWMQGRGARWVRLGVVKGNARAERFWQGRGFMDVRLRTRVQMGARVNDLRVMAKPLAGGTLAEYLQLVPRDRPDRIGSPSP